MAVQHLLAVVPVADIERARDFYTRLFGREPDNNPMPTLVEWQVVTGGWVQVTVDPDRAGNGLLNLAVDDLAAQRKEVAGRGIELADVIDANKGVQLSPLADPDGNAVTLIGGFREVY